MSDDVKPLFETTTKPEKRAPAIPREKPPKPPEGLSLSTLPVNPRGMSKAAYLMQMKPGDAFIADGEIERAGWCGQYSRLRIDGHGRWYSKKIRERRLPTQPVGQRGGRTLIWRHE